MAEMGHVAEVYVPSDDDLMMTRYMLLRGLNARESEISSALCDFHGCRRRGREVYASAYVTECDAVQAHWTGAIGYVVACNRHPAPSELLDAVPELEPDALQLTADPLFRFTWVMTMAEMRVWLEGFRDSQN